MSSPRRCPAWSPTRCRAGRRWRARGPGRSSGTCAPRLSLRRRGASTAAVSPIGTLIQKIQCQSSVLTRTPPSSGPSATPRPGDGRPQAECRRAPLDRERGGQQGQRERHQECGADALDGAREHELREVLGERSRGRGRREDEQPDDEHAAAAVAIAERGSRQDEDGEREDVRVDDPLQPVDRDPEVALHRRQRREDDQVVERDHEERGAREGDGPDVRGAGGHEISVMYDELSYLGSMVIVHLVRRLSNNLGAGRGDAGA